MEESAKPPYTAPKMITHIPMASVSTILKHVTEQDTVIWEKFDVKNFSSLMRLDEN